MNRLECFSVRCQTSCCCDLIREVFLLSRRCDREGIDVQVIYPNVLMSINSFDDELVQV